MKKVVIFCMLALAIASAQTKQRVAVLPSVGELAKKANADYGVMSLGANIKIGWL